MGQSSSSLKSSNGKNIALKETVNWDEAVQLNFEDGSTGFVVPMGIKISSTSAPLRGSFSILISKINGKFRAVRLYAAEEKSKSEERQVLGSEVRREYKAILEGSNSIVNIHSSKKNSVISLKTSKVNTRLPQKLLVRDSGGGGELPGEPCIIELFWTITVTDWLGHVLLSGEVYLYSTPCEQSPTRTRVVEKSRRHCPQ